MPPSFARWNVLRSGTPGRRFRDRYHRNQHAESSHGLAWKIVRVIAAAAAFAVGVILAVLPGPAIVFFLLAGALLASDWLWMARLMDWGEVKARAVWSWAKSFWKRLPTGGRIALAVVGAGVSAASTYGFYRLLH